MLVLKILGILVGITVIYTLIQKLNKKCIEKLASIDGIDL